MSLWIAIFPFDVVKSRMQIHQTNLPMVSLLLKIGRDEGMTHCLFLFDHLLSVCISRTFL